MFKSKIKKGDEVVVIAGSERGKRGKVVNIAKEKQRITIEGVKLVKHYVKKTEKQEGGIIEREASIHYSNVMLAERHESKKTKKPN